MREITTRRTAAGLLVSVALSLLVAGCGSSGTVVASPRSSSTATATVPTTTVRMSRLSPPAPSAKDEAVALSNRMVGEAVLPAGAMSADTPLPSELRGPWEVPAGVNLVGVHRVWSVPMPPEVLVSFLETHAPTGFVENGVGTFTSPSTRVMDVVDELARLPSSIAVAGLEIGVEAHGAGSLVNVIAGAQWTVLRPRDERVGDRDAAVVVSELPWSHDAPAGRRVVATGTRRSAIVRAFNMQKVSATVGGGCFALGANTVSYHVAFATSAGAAPDIVATIAPCAPVGVTVNGRRSVSLAWGSGALDSAVAHALGESNLTFASSARTETV